MGWILQAAECMAKEGGRDKERPRTPSLNRVFTAPPLFSKWAAEDSRETKGKKKTCRYEKGGKKKRASINVKPGRGSKFLPPMPRIRELEEEPGNALLAFEGGGGGRRSGYLFVGRRR